METTGGAFLLQEVKPTALLGTFACLVTGPRRGWISAAVFVSSPELLITIEQRGYRFTMSREVAMRLASLLQLLVVQSQEAVGKLDAVTHGDPSLTVDRDLVVLSTATTSAGITYEVVDDQLNVRMHPSVAERIATSIWGALAQYALTAHNVHGR